NNGLYRSRRQKAIAAQIAAAKKTGFSSAASLAIKSQAKRAVGCQRVSSPPRPSRCVTVIHPFWAFQISTGNMQNALTSSARYRPGRFHCARAGLQSAKKTNQQSHCNNDVYLLRKPSPIQSPVQSQCRVESSWTARQPETIA